MARWTRGRVRIAPLDSPEADALLAGVDPELRYEQAWLVGKGKRYEGHEAIWHSLYLIPGGALLRVFRWIPGFQPVCRRIYRWIADHRNPSCRIPRP